MLAAMLLVVSIATFGRWSEAAATADMTKRDTLAVSMSFDLPNNVLVDQPFDLAFRVTVHDSVPHANDSLDEIDIMLPEECEILSGKPYWQGMLYRGCSVAVRVRARITEPTKAAFLGYVYSGYISGRMNLYRTVNYLASQEISVSSLAKDSTHSEPVEPLTAPSQKRCLVLPPNDLLGVSADAKPQIIPIEILSSSTVVKDVCKLDRSAINTLSFWMRKSASSPLFRVLPQRWQLSCPLYDMALNSDSTATLLVDPMVDTTTLSVQLEETRYQIRLRASTKVVSGNQ